MALVQKTLNAGEVDISIGTNELVEFVVAVDEIVVIQNFDTAKQVTVLFQVSNDVNRQWFVLKPGESTRIDKTMFFRALHDFETITLVTDRA